MSQAQAILMPTGEFYFMSELSLYHHKRDTDKQCRPRSDAENATSDQRVYIFTSNKGISINRSNNKN